MCSAARKSYSSIMRPSFFRVAVPIALAVAFAVSPTLTSFATGPKTYEIGYLGPFKFAERFSGTTVYTLDGETTGSHPSHPDHPMFAVIPAARPTADREAGTVDAITNVAVSSHAALAVHIDTNRAAIEKEGPVEIAGMSGYAIEARGPDHRTNRIVVIYYAIVHDPVATGHHILMGSAGVEQASHLMPEFRRMARSYAHRSN